MCYTQNEVIGMLGVPYDNIFLKFGEHIFQQIICIPYGNKLCSSPGQSFPPKKLIKDKRITEAKPFNLTFRHIDDILAINNPNFANWIPLI